MMNNSQEQNLITFQSYSSSLQNLRMKKFLFKQRIGTGTEGAVFLAQTIDRYYNVDRVAIKLQQSVKQEVREFYEKLILQQEKISQSNSNEQSQIIKIYEIGQIQDQFAVIMEVGENDLYKHLLNAANLDILTRQKICLKLAYAIKQLHELMYIHRDIKPENFIVIKNEFKLIDFGLTKSISDLINNTMNIGSRIFQAPELLEGDGNYTSAIDIWALGCTFYEILTYSPLINGKTLYNAQKIIINHRNDQSFIYNKIDQLQVQQQWKEMMKEMLNPNEKFRISAKQVVKKIESIINPDFKKFNHFIVSHPADIINNQPAKQLGFINFNNVPQQNNNLYQQPALKGQQFIPQKNQFQTLTQNVQQNNFPIINLPIIQNQDTKNQNFLKFHQQQLSLQLPEQIQTGNSNVNKWKDDQIQELEQKIQIMENTIKDQNQRIEELQQNLEKQEIYFDAKLQEQVNYNKQMESFLKKYKDSFQSQYQEANLLLEQNKNTLNCF